jgi:DNA-binding HxlR family transcriptional regulator
MSSTKNDFQKQTECVAHTTVALGDKWSPCLIFALMKGPMRFSELQENLRNINPRTLSQRLAKLEAMKIIEKKTISQTPLHTEYSLTDKGRELAPILKTMITWGEKYGQAQFVSFDL